MDAVHKNFYVYDYIGLHRNNDSAKESFVNITKLLPDGRFRLRKWISTYQQSGY